MDLKDWDALKRRYPKTYEPKYSARTTCANFSDLIQKSVKTINDYHLRVQTAYKRLTDSKPTRHEQDSRQSPYQSGKNIVPFGTPAFCYWENNLVHDC